MCTYWFPCTEVTVRTDISKFNTALRDFLPENLQPASPPWLQSLLFTNDPPTPSTEQILLNALPLHEEESKELDSKLSDSIQLFDFLTRQVLAAKAHVHNIKTITHPIRRIPDEVWRELLLFVAASSAGSSSIYDTPWLLAQVCHRWRVVAINTGALWTDIQLYFSMDHLLVDPKCSDAACSILGERLIRCRSAPRDITIDAAYLHLQDHPVFKLILTHTASWRSLKINTNSINYSFLQTRQGFFSSLESLRISDTEFYDSRGTTYDQNALDAFSVVPNMTLFDVQDIPVTHLTLAPAGNTSIRRLGISLASQGLAVMNTLQSMTWLSCLDLTCNGTVLSLPHTIDLISLRRLLLRDPQSTNMIPHVWRQIHVPALTCLALCYEDEDGDQPIYPSLLTPHTSITDFRVYFESDVENAELYESALVAILYNLPNVTVLKLESCNPWPILVEELYNNVECLPRLNQLHYLVDTALSNDEADMFVRMLQRRKDSPRCAIISHLFILTYPIMNPITQHLWDSIMNDEIQPVEVLQVHDEKLYNSRAFLVEVD